MRRLICDLGFRTAAILLSATVGYFVIMDLAARFIFGISIWSHRVPALLGSFSIACMLVSCWPERRQDPPG